MVVGVEALGKSIINLNKKRGMNVNHKKLIWVSLVVSGVIILLLLIMTRPLTISDLHKKPSFIGTVLEVDSQSMLVLVDPDEEAYQSADKIWVSLDVLLKDSMTSFTINDQVKVFYDGQIAESYPAQIHRVYAILLVD